MAAPMAALALLANSTRDIWAPLRAGAEAWHALQFDGEFSVNVGNDHGTLFRWESPGFSSSKTRMAGASLSKWPAAIMIAGLVNDGTLHWDDLASKHLSWWTTDPKDPRSRIRLKHLLSFTSGYTANSFAVPWCTLGVAAKDQYMACAKSLYHNLGVKNSYEPGTTWAYLTCHLQFAGAMAVAASGLEIDHLFERYLYRPFNMTSTTWRPRKSPPLAGGITTTADDFEQMLRRLLTYEVLPKQILDVIETDYSQPPVNPSGDGWFGHYGMGHWWECIGYGTPQKPYERLKLPQDCLDAAVQAGPGLFGYYPLLDRSEGGGAAGPKRPRYYFQIALQESTSLSGIPEYLRIAAKPVVDAILSGADLETYPKEELLAAGAGLLQRDLDDIASALKTCTCAKAKLRKGEPYATLANQVGLQADEPNFTRRELTKRRKEGLLLRDIVAAQEKLGACECTGRRGAAAEVAAAARGATVEGQLFV